MTAHPHSFDFSKPDSSGTPIMVQPKLTERYWGYEVAKNELEFDLAVLARLTACLVMIGTFVAAFGIWMVPVMAFAGTATLAKIIVSVCLLSIAGTLFQFAGHSTRVRVQVDTANGELREVVAGPFGSDAVLTRYGLDAVEAVRVVTSKLDGCIGQLQITLKSGMVVPVGDGTLVALRHLRDRMASDCGTKPSGEIRGAVWTGPITR